MHQVVRLLPLAVALLPCTFGGNITLLTWQPICNGVETTCGWPAGKSMTIASKLMVDRINAAGFLRGGHQLHLVVQDTSCSQQEGVEKTTELLLTPADARPFGVVGCGCSSCTMMAAPPLTIARVPIISQSATSAVLSDRRKYPNFFRITPPDQPLIESFLSIFASFGWWKLSMVIDAVQEERWSEWWELAMKRMNMIDVVGGLRSRVLQDTSDARVQVALNDVVRLKARGLIIIGYAGIVRALACGMRRMKIRGLVVAHFGWFSPTWVSEGNDALSCTVAEMQAATELFINSRAPAWNSLHLPAPCDNGAYTVQDFADEYHRRREAEGVEWRTEASSSADAICMMAQLINALLDDGRSLAEISPMDSATFTRAIELMQLTRFEGISGTVAFPSDGTVYGGGDRVAPFLLFQRVNGSNNNVGIVRPFEAPTFYESEQLIFGDGFSQANPPPHSFPTCELGMIYDFAARECVGCPQNRVFIQAAGACLPVPGFYEAPAGAARPCAPGNYSSTAGARVCDSCEVGRFSPAGASSCKFCPRGTFSAESGLANCTSCASVKPRTTTRSIASTQSADCVCEVGTYQSADGTCQVCPDGSSTSDVDKRSVAACLCQEGTYMPLDGSVCRPCPLGMKCVLGSSQANFARVPGLLIRDKEEERVPVLLPGFYSGSTYGFLSAFSCRDSKRCPGGDPTVGSCSPHSWGLGCEHCEEYRHWNGTECVLCSDVHASQVFFPVMPCLLVPLVTLLLYFTKGKETLALRWNRVGNTRNALFFIVLNHYQVVDLTRGASLQLPGEVESAIGIFSWTTDAGSLFNVQCTGYSRFEPTMMVKSTAPIIVTLLMVATFAMSVLLAKLARTPYIALSVDRLFNVWGTVMFSFFTAIVGLSLLLFKCTSHPNGKLTLSGDRSILCYETGAWRNMLGVAVAAVVVYVIGLGALFTRTVIRAPSPGFFETPSYQTRWAFLFIRYRPEAYWFSIVYLLKNFLVNLGYVLFSDGVWQIYSCFCVQVMYSGLVVIYRPYRSKYVYFAEIIISASLLNVAPLLTWFSDRGISGTQFDRSVGHVLIAWSFVPLAIWLIAAGWLTLRVILWKEQFTEQRREEFARVHRALGCFSALQLADGLDFYRKLGDWDRLLFSDTARCIEVEIMGWTDRSRTCDTAAHQNFRDEVAYLEPQETEVSALPEKDTALVSAFAQSVQEEVDVKDCMPEGANVYAVPEKDVGLVSACARSVQEEEEEEEEVEVKDPSKVIGRISL